MVALKEQKMFERKDHGKVFISSTNDFKSIIIFAIFNICGTYIFKGTILSVQKKNQELFLKLLETEL